jgi:hypothetical protein
MKLFLLATVFSCGLHTFAQGTITFGQVAFGNFTSEGKFPVYYPDCVTLVSGSGFQAQMYGGPAGAPVTALVPVGSPVAFRTGIAAGFWTEDLVTVTVVPSGSPAVVQARVWETAAGSYQNAVASGRLYGASNPIEVIPNGPIGGLPPAEMIGLQSFCLVPEPSTFVIGLLGAGVLFGWCRFGRRG